MQRKPDRLAWGQHAVAAPQPSKRFSRRTCLTVGALTGLGLSLPAWFAAKAAAAGRGTTFGSAKTVIIIYLHGGHPQHETFDPKPEAPAEIRGEFQPIATRLPGCQFSELFPQMASIADKLTIIRSLAHGNTNHVQACLPALTGHVHGPEVRGRGDFPPSERDFPPYGAVIDHLRGLASGVPNWVQIGPLMTRSNGTVLHGQLPGFLGRRHSPLAIDQDLVPDDVTIEAVSGAEGMTTLRLEARRDLLGQIDAQQRLIERSAEARDMDAYVQKAFSLLTSGAVNRAFHLAAEPRALRDAYGRHHVGQSCLLARRLAEVGVPMINVHFCRTPRGSWDTHGNNFRQMKNVLAPVLDQAFTALVTDLDQRGMLDDVLVVAMAEFGRTPKINSKAGRDHWPFVYTAALAGAGVQPGTVYGSSDTLGAYPASNPHDPRDFAATLYHLLGVPDDTILHDLTGRPHSLVIGRKIDGILRG